MTDDEQEDREKNRAARLGYDPRMNEPSGTRSKSRGAHGDRLCYTDLPEAEEPRSKHHGRIVVSTDRR